MADCALGHFGSSTRSNDLQPLQEAKRRAAGQLFAFLVRHSSEVDLEEQLVDFVERTIHKATAGFRRQDSRASENPGLAPSWIPVVPAELFDCLEGAGLVRRIEETDSWFCSLEWIEALLGLMVLMRGSFDLVTRCRLELSGFPQPLPTPGGGLALRPR